LKEVKKIETLSYQGISTRKSDSLGFRQPKEPAIRRKTSCQIREQPAKNMLQNIDHLLSLI
jgi:hypothetical protein